MAIKFLAGINLGQNELQNAVVQTKEGYEASVEEDEEDEDKIVAPKETMHGRGTPSSLPRMQSGDMDTIGQFAAALQRLIGSHNGGRSRGASRIESEDSVFDL